MFIRNEPNETGGTAKWYWNASVIDELLRLSAW